MLCPNGMTQPISSYINCNFGSIPANIVMTSALKTLDVREAYKKFLLQASEWFGEGKPYSNSFPMFTSDKWITSTSNDQRNLLFTDTTKKLVDVGDKDTYYKWVGEYTHGLSPLLECGNGLSADVIHVSSQDLKTLFIC